MKRSNNDNHESVDIDLIYSAIYEINHKYNMCINVECFLDPVRSRFCTAVVRDSVLFLDFPVASTIEFAEIALPFDINNFIDTESMTFNSTFQLEIDNKSFY